MVGTSSQTPRPHLATLADLLAIPEEDRFHEILDGELLRKELAGFPHAMGQTRVNRLLSPPFDRRPNGPSRPGGWWFATEATIELSLHQIVQPDVAAWRRERLPEIPDVYPIRLRPDWVCEIMGGADARRRDGVQKRRIYADHGVPHCWLVDSERERLTVLRLTDRGYVEILEAGRGERVRAEPFDALELPVGVLFGDDED